MVACARSAANTIWFVGLRVGTAKRTLDRTLSRALRPHPSWLHLNDLLARSHLTPAHSGFINIKSPLSPESPKIRRALLPDDDRRTHRWYVDKLNRPVRAPLGTHGIRDGGGTCGSRPLAVIGVQDSNAATPTASAVFGVHSTIGRDNATTGESLRVEICNTRSHSTRWAMPAPGRHRPQGRPPPPFHQSPRVARLCLRPWLR